MFIHSTEINSAAASEVAGGAAVLQDCQGRTAQR